LLVVQGDNGVVIPFETDMDLTNCTVAIVTVARPDGEFTKDASIINILTGSCNFTFLSDDLTIAGDYQYQWTVTFNDGTVKNGLITTIKVHKKLGNIISQHDNVPPYPVTNLSVSNITTTSSQVSWVLSASPDVTNYEVAYSSDNGTNFTVASNLINKNSNTFTITGLTALTTYILRVVAIDGAGNRSNDMTISVTTLDISTIVQTAIVGSAVVGTSTVA
jgi:hypothetical protein